MKGEISPFGAFGIYDLPRQEWLCLPTNLWNDAMKGERVYTLVQGITTYGDELPHVKIGGCGWTVVKITHPSAEEMRLMQEWD